MTGYGGGDIIVLNQGDDDILIVDLEGNKQVCTNGSMAEKENGSKERTGVSENPTPKSTQPKIGRDNSNMRRSYANAFDVSVTREEIVLLFGVNQAEDARQQQATVQPLERLILNPFTAKRLATSLNNLIQEYESKFGPLEVKSLPSAGPGQMTSTQKKPPFRKTERTHEKADLLFQLVKSLHAEVGFERSFKIVNAVLLNNRFLLGVSKKSVGQRADDRLTQTCSLMGMPKTLLNVFRHHLPKGNYVHFGFEQNEKTFVYKVYLEFWETIKEEIGKSKDRPGPMLLHLGLKWDVSDPARQSLTHYTWYPWLSADEILERVSRMLDPQTDTPAKQAADELISLALARIPARDLLYLEVTEEGNPRRSFDINVYRANLQLAEVYPLLSMLCRRHSIPFDTFHSLYNGIKMKRFGHLAAGADREGNNFFTAYYGVEETFGESSRGTPLSNAGAAVPSRYSLPVRRRRIVRIEETDDKAGHFFHLVEDLGLRGGLEHSFKFLHRILLADRFLFGVKRPKGSVGQDDAILDVCRHIDMPEDYREMFRTELQEANIVLFGFEKNEKNRVYKAYLEFSGRLAEAVKQDPRPENVVIYTGFKWDVADNSRKVVAKYTAYPLFRAEDMARRVASSFYGGSRNPPYPIVDDILDLAGSRTQPGELLYFEASEEGNLRKSFDINMYWANLQMAEIYPLLVNMARHYSIDLDQFEELYGAVKTQKFGHLSGGTDREGRDFLTVYFSEKGSSRR